MDKTCEFKGCDDKAFRHLMWHHFCNPHNEYLREKAQDEEPDELQRFGAKAHGFSRGMKPT